MPLVARARSFLSGLLRPIMRRGGWTPLVIREPFTGAWQQNAETKPDTVLAYFAVYACTTLIARDIAKLRLRLVVKDSAGIWTETENSAYSPVLRKPNRYQTIIAFLEQWIVSKLVHGNAYVLKQRDGRGVVVALYVLDATQVTPLVAPDGSVFYQLARDDLSGIPASDFPVTVPASEIIHDLMCPLFHPLVGVSPIYACGLAATEGLKIQGASTQFFANGSRPGGVLTAPGAISDETATRVKTYWETNFSGDNVGKVAVLGDALKYEPLTVTATDAQLIEQLKWTAETVCSAYHVPPFMINVGPYPPYANTEPAFQQYYSQCLQSLVVSLETCLEEGIGLGPQFENRYGTEFDIDELIWMDTNTRTTAARDGIGGGALAPDEARRKYYGLGPVPGGATPYLQQQNYSLAALAERDASQPFVKSAPAPAALPPAIEAGLSRAELTARAFVRAREIAA